VSEENNGPVFVLRLFSKAQLFILWVSNIILKILWNKFLEFLK